MDSASIHNMKHILGGDPDNKISKLLNYTERGGDVDDPWYSGRFDIAYRNIYDGCSGFLRKIIKED